MRYDSTTYKKHKRPKGWGSPCPETVTQEDAQALLDTSAVHGEARFNVEGAFCYRAFAHDVDPDGTTLWHGHPIPWARLPVAAKNDLIARGRLDSATFRKALRQGWGSEFSG